MVWNRIRPRTFAIWTRANQKSSLRTKTYRKYVLRKRVNNNALSLMKVLWSRVNQNVFTKASTQTKKFSIDETEDEGPSVTDAPVIKEPRYFNLFECGKQYLEQD